jgi:signal transduction histidine kinase/CheY-like chemotaxis protein
MTDAPRTAAVASYDERVLVRTPTGRDAEIAERALRESQLDVLVCVDGQHLCREIERGAAAVLMTDDVLEPSVLPRLACVIEAQAEWSELPFVVLARGGQLSPPIAWLQSRTSVTLLERAVLMRTLVSAVLMSVRSRRRQYQVRDLLHAERQARLEADRASAAKDRFLAVLSHELRTPLTPIVLASATLQRQIPPGSSMRRPLEMISRNVALETKLIDDLLDLSRVVQGKLPLQKSTLDLHDTLQDALGMVAHDARAKGVSLHTRLDAVSRYVSADPARVQQVVWNITKNAIKFTPAGGTVTIRTWNEEDAFLLSCTDDGIGIPPETLPRLFQPFEQGNPNITKAYGGLGLGLAVSRSLIEAHGGSLSAHSDGPDCGATFTIRLPGATDRAASTDRPAVNGHARDGASEGVKVLLVEDHFDTAQAVRDVLTSLGHEVRWVQAVGDALRAAAASRFELLISDIGLPDGSGLDLVRQIAPRPSLGAIALSGFGMDDDLKRSRAAGFDRHLTKPVDPAQLEDAIAELQVH